LERKVAIFRIQHRYHRELRPKGSRQLFLDTAAILRHVEQLLMKATPGRKADDKGMTGESNRLTSGENGLQDATSAAQTFQQHLPFGGNLSQR
jgi:hypothetical protein